MADMAFNIIHVSNMDIEVEGSLPTTLILFVLVILSYLLDACSCSCNSTSVVLGELVLTNAQLVLEVGSDEDLATFS